MSKIRIPEYGVWASMKTRCFNANDPSYRNYGARGIRVCDRWRYSFDAFLEDMGHRPSKRHSINRINNDGHYEPSNCAWATPEEQAENKRNSLPPEKPFKKASAAWRRDYVVDGVRGSLLSLCKRFGVSRPTIYHRMNYYHLTVEEAFNHWLASYSAKRRWMGNAPIKNTTRNL